MAERSSTPSSSTQQSGSRAAQPVQSTSASSEDSVFKAVDDCIEQLYTHFAKLENSPELADTLSIVTMLKGRMIVMKAQSDAKQAVTTASSEESAKD
jgi:uncharacterized membrane protein